MIRISKRENGKNNAEEIIKKKIKKGTIYVSSVKGPTKVSKKQWEKDHSKAHHFEMIQYLK